MKVSLDKLGKQLHKGCLVARAVVRGNSPGLDICEVTSVSENGDVFLDGSNKALIYTNRVVIVGYIEN
jgi:hypothetical protein